MANEFQNILLILMQLFLRLWKQLEVYVLKNKYRSWLQWTSNFLSKTKKMFYFSLMSILFFSCHSNHSTPISFNYPDPNSKLYTICRQDLWALTEIPQKKNYAGQKWFDAEQRNSLRYEIMHKCRLSHVPR